ncbi:hypothetical protein LCGC14_2728210, partial [marine sediment metagenome]
MFTGGLNPIGIAVLALAAIGGFWAGSSLKQAAWDRAENKALVLQQELDQQSEDERKALNKQVLGLQIDLEQAERNTERMSDEIQDAINRAAVVTTFSPAVPKDCPAVRCNIVDAAKHYRLFNDAINNTLEEVSPTGSTRLGNASLPRAVPASGVDGA